MSYNQTSVKRAVDASGNDIMTYINGAGAHIQAVAPINIHDVNDLAEVGDITYIGIENANAEWILKRIDESSGFAIRYATIANNGGYSTYSSAWTARASLNYGLYSELF
jgi:hypothetical protein